MVIPFEECHVCPTSVLGRRAVQGHSAGICGLCRDSSFTVLGLGLVNVPSRYMLTGCIGDTFSSNAFG